MGLAVAWNTSIDAWFQFKNNSRFPERFLVPNLLIASGYWVKIAAAAFGSDMKGLMWAEEQQF